MEIPEFRQKRSILFEYINLGKVANDALYTE